MIYLDVPKEPRYKYIFFLNYRTINSFIKKLFKNTTAHNDNVSIIFSRMPYALIGKI